MDIIKLREMLEAELSSEELGRVDPSLYEDFRSLVKALKISAQQSKERGEDVEESLYLEQLKIAEGIMREIIRLRLHKLVDMAFSGAPTGEVPAEERGLLSVLIAFIEGETPKAPEEPVSEPREEMESPRKRPGEVFIVTADVPVVVDSSLREHGPIRAGDMVVLPGEIGAVLEKRGVAIRVHLRT